jgi:hypothetical protein
VRRLGVCERVRRIRVCELMRRIWFCRQCPFARGVGARFGPIHEHRFDLLQRLEREAVPDGCRIIVAGVSV